MSLTFARSSYVERHKDPKTRIIVFPTLPLEGCSSNLAAIVCLGYLTLEGVPEPPNVCWPIYPSSLGCQCQPSSTPLPTGFWNRTLSYTIYAKHYHDYISRTKWSPQSGNNWGPDLLTFGLLRDDIESVEVRVSITRSIIKIVVIAVISGAMGSFGNQATVQYVVRSEVGLWILAWNATSHTGMHQNSIDERCCWGGSNVWILWIQFWAVHCSYCNSESAGLIRRGEVKLSSRILPTLD